MTMEGVRVVIYMKMDKKMPLKMGINYGGS